MPVTNVAEDERQDQAGNLVPTYVITFTVGSRPGTFTTTVDQSGDPVAAAESAIAAISQQVNGIYGI